MEEAKATIAKIKGCDINDSIVQQECNHLLTATGYVRLSVLEEWRAFRSNIFRHRSSGLPNTSQSLKISHRKWWRAAIGCLLQIYYTWSGLQIFLFLQQINFPNAGLAIRISSSLTLLSWTLFAIGSVVTIFTVDITGRRKGMLFAFSGQAILSTLILILTGVRRTSSNTSSTVHMTFALGALAILFTPFAGSANGLTWLYQVEFNAWSFRMAGSALATLASWIGVLTGTYSLALLYITMEGLLGIYVGVNVLAAVSIYLLCPETGGRSLEWLDLLFTERPPVVVSRHKYLTKVVWTRSDEEMRHSERVSSV